MQTKIGSGECARGTGKKSNLKPKIFVFADMNMS